jgi:hypothetical protein
MKTVTLPLPNGILDTGNQVVKTITIRQLNGSDEDYLANDRNMGEGLEHTFLQRAIIGYDGMEVTPDTESQKRANTLFGRMLQADYFFAVIALRRHTLGDLVRTRRPCPNKRCEAHRNAPMFPVDLSKCEISDGDPEIRKGVREFSTKLSTGKVVNFRPSYVKDMAIEAELRRNHADEIASRLMMFYITSINGKKPTSLTEFLEDEQHGLSWAERAEYRDAADEPIYGVNVHVDYVCPRCQQEWTAPLSMGRSFFYPGREKGTFLTGTATPSRESGRTLSSWLKPTDGAQEKSEP